MAATPLQIATGLLGPIPSILWLSLAVIPLFLLQVYMGYVRVSEKKASLDRPSGLSTGLMNYLI